MLRAEDLPPKVRARLGIKAKRGRPKKDDEDQADRDFLFQCQQLGLPPVFAQWRFPCTVDPRNRRKMWRTDFVFQEPWKLMVEIDGGIWIKGAHGHPTDIIRNMAKGNDAIALGFVVLHFTPAEVKSGHAISFTEKVLKAKGWKAWRKLQCTSQLSRHCCWSPVARSTQRKRKRKSVKRWAANTIVSPRRASAGRYQRMCNEPPNRQHQKFRQPLAQESHAQQGRESLTQGKPKREGQMITNEQLAQIRKSIENEDEVRQRTHAPKPMHQNSSHRRLLLAEVDRLRELVNTVGPTS